MELVFWLEASEKTSGGLLFLLEAPDSAVQLLARTQLFASIASHLMLVHVNLKNTSFCVPF